LVKNPDYWQYDVRYPQNKLPYINELKVLIIPDDATALAGLRAGKIDDLDGMSFQQAQDIKKTNPEIVQVKVPCSFGLTIDPRNDVKPFNDIKVRQVMQMAIDLPTIAKNYYNDTVDPYPVALTSRYMTGWGLPYSLWPQDLKDQYAYNPTKAKQLLSDAGYPNGFDTDIMVDSAYDMDLLQIVQSYFNAVNIRMTIKTLDLASWVTIVNTSHKHDQISARSTGVMLGKTTEPISQLTKFLSNSTETAIVRDTVYDAFYTKALAVTTVDQVKQIVSDCNKYIAQQHYVISLLQPMYYSLVQPWLKGYNGQSNAISGADGPSLLFFYPARFWIDQKVKNMGY
jgi:peptide/nickel transport system substrate-binding protein